MPNSEPKLSPAYSFLVKQQLQVFVTARAWLLPANTEPQQKLKGNF